MSARLLSLVVVVLLLHVAINALPGLWLPVASPFGWFRAAFALQVALLMQTVFACGTIVALQGAVSLALPAGVAGRVSSGLQGRDPARGGPPLRGRGGDLAPGVRDARQRPPGEPGGARRVVPRALRAAPRGGLAAPLAAQARLAWIATGVALAAAVPCSLLGFRDAGAGREGRSYVGGLAPSRLGALLEGGPARPVARAVSSFVAAALRRSPSAGLIARGLFVVGLALTLSGLGGLALRELGHSAPIVPAEPLYAPAFVLPFFALVGLRLSGAYPASIEANWIFRLTETRGSTDYVAGVRWASLRTVVAPLLALLAVPYAALWGPRMAAAHLLLGLGVALVTVEWLFLGFPKIPFTCTYLPGKANLRATWPKYAAIFLVYGSLVPRLGAWLLARPAAYVVGLASLTLAWRWLARVREGEARAGRLVFDDRADPHVTVLGLEWRHGRRPPTAVGRGLNDGSNPGGSRQR